MRVRQFGFREEHAGGWTFGFEPERAEEELGHLSGPFSELCRIIGGPVVRLRAAIPEELLEGDIGAIFTRAGGRTEVLCGRMLAASRLRIQSRSCVTFGAQSGFQLCVVRAGSALGRQVGLSATAVAQANNLMERKMALQSKKIAARSKKVQSKFRFISPDPVVASAIAVR